MKIKKECTLTILILILIILNLNYTQFYPKAKFSEDQFLEFPLTANSDSILFNNFTYEWNAIMNDNPFLFYAGIENYTNLGGNVYRCNESIRFQYNPPDNDYRDVNSSTRHFPTSFYWGNDKHDWVWIFKNTTINTKNIPIATFQAGGPETEHLFNVTGESVVNLNSNSYNVWVLEDSAGSIASYEKNTGILISGTFYFLGAQTWTITMNKTNVNIPTNDNPPILNNPEVSPTMGDLTTEFSFTVNYSDPENNLPTDINVIMNDTIYPMEKQNSSDVNYRDGVIYEYKTFLSNGTYQYFFNASDGRFSTNTSVYSGPDVSYNNIFIPTLSDISLYPLLGYNTSTLFQYRVKYSDLDNNPPIYVNLTINNTIYSMQKEDSLDLNYMDGSFYEFEIFLNETGHYIYNFSTSDGENNINLPSTGFYYNPNVTLHNLNEVDIGWVISHEETSNATYSNFLTDATNLGAISKEYYQKIDPYLLNPFEILIIEEGGNSWKENELNILKKWVENGGRLIILGDDRDDAQSSVSNIFNVSYGDYSGSGGSSTQIYHPHYLTAGVNSIVFGPERATIDLDASDPSLNIIVNSSDGTPQACLLELGFGKVLWVIDEILENTWILEGDNRLFGLNVLRWMGEIKTNDYVPSFSNPSFNPTTGNSTTFYTFSVNYTDEDNRGPIFINVSINQDSFSMVKQEPNDYNYKDGVIFKYTTTLQNGTHQFYFNASDGVYEIYSSIMAGPLVGYINNFDPQLTLGGVSPEIGFEHSVFKFQVNYSDRDNNAPKYVNAIIDDIPYSMEKEDYLDNYFIDGVIYHFETNLSIGMHEYYFNTSDAERSTSTGIKSGPIVYVSPLIGKNIAWITTHGELSSTSYTKLLNDAIYMGAAVTNFNSMINTTTLQNFDIIVISDGGTGWSSEELSAVEKWVINGSSILILGDERDASQVSVSSMFNLYYSTQTGTSGNSSQIYGPHNVTYGVSTVYFPYPESTISPISNKYLTPLINDRNGRLTIGSLQYGTGRIMWVVEDCFIDSQIMKVDNNLLSNNSWIWLADTTLNNNTPTISEGSVNPSAGNSRTIFDFYLNYTDPDGGGPVFVNITINGTNYLMTKQNQYDFNFTSGIIYNFSIQLSPGIYYYYFNVSDGKFNASYPIDALSLSVSSVNLESPIFIDTIVDPYLGFGNTTIFTFQAIYQDFDNTPPNYLRISIDENQYDMVKFDPFDLSYHDGVIYQFQIILELGEHTYSIKAFDGVYTINNPASGTHLGPIVVEETPLSSKKIGWISNHGEDNYNNYAVYLNDAVALGATFTEITETITLEILLEYDICIVGEGGMSWSEAELNALAQWVYSGKSLFIIGDTRDASMVSVSNKFDAYYKAYSSSIYYTSNFSQPHTLTNGLRQLYTYPYTALDEATSTSNLVKLVRDKNGELIVATLAHGGGKVTWICDDDILRNDIINEVDNRLFANNTWLWAIEVTPTSIDGEEDNLMLIIIIGSSSVGAGVIIGVMIFIRKRKKSKNVELIDRIVDDIQDKKT